MKFFKHEWFSRGRCIRPILAVLGVMSMVVSVPLYAQEAVTVQGEIVDLACYMSKGSKGTQHRACAQMCAKKGVPIGVLTDSGEVYLLVDDHEDPEPYEAARKLAGDRAEVSGKKFAKGGVATIVVGAAKGL